MESNADSVGRGLAFFAAIVSLKLGNSGKEKLSSDQHTLSRRNASVAKRFPVCRSTRESSIRPKWQHALPRTKYLRKTSV